MDTSNKPRVGFAGLGIMGRGMSQNLLEKGYELSVWNRTPARAEPFARRARVAATPRELAEGSDVVIACVSDSTAVERVVFAPDGVLGAARPGFRYVECSTVDPGLTQRVASAFRAIGADALEAPVTGSKLGAQAGTLLMMTGGRRETHDELVPVLLAMGSRAVYCGPSGHGALMKLVGNALISFMLTGLVEGLVAARQGGLSIETVLEVIAASGYCSPFYAFKGRALAARDFETHFALDLLVKDQSLMLAQAAETRTPMPVLAAIRELFQAARAQGHGAQDIAAVIEAVEQAAGI